MPLVYMNIIMAFTVSLVGLLTYQSHLMSALLCLEGMMLSLFVMATLLILNSLHFSQHNTHHPVSVCSLRGHTQIILASNSIKHMWHRLHTKP